MNVLSSFLKLLLQKEAGIVNRAARHLIAGGIGTLLYMLFTVIFVEILSFHPVLGACIAFLGLEIYTYAVSRVWVYDPSENHTYAIPRFLTVTFIALFLNTSIMYIVVEPLQLWYVWGLLATTFVVPPTNFLLNYYWAFK